MEGEEAISCDPKSHVPGSKGTVLVDTRIEGPQHECLSLGSPVR